MKIQKANCFCCRHDAILNKTLELIKAVSQAVDLLRAHLHGSPCPPCTWALEGPCQGSRSSTSPPNPLPSQGHPSVCLPVPATCSHYPTTGPPSPAWIPASASSLASRPPAPASCPLPEGLLKSDRPPWPPASAGSSAWLFQAQKSSPRPPGQLRGPYGLLPGHVSTSPPGL